MPTFKWWYMSFIEPHLSHTQKANKRFRLSFMLTPIGFCKDQHLFLAPFFQNAFISGCVWSCCMLCSRYFEKKLLSFHRYIHGAMLPFSAATKSFFLILMISSVRLCLFLCWIDTHAKKYCEHGRAQNMRSRSIEEGSQKVIFKMKYWIFPKLIQVSCVPQKKLHYGIHILKVYIKVRIHIFYYYILCSTSGLASTCSFSCSSWNPKICMNFPFNTHPVPFCHMKREKTVASW